MSTDHTESGRERFLEALEVRKNATRGFGFGFAVTLLVYVVFVVLPGVPLMTGLWYAGLGLSLATAIGALVTGILVALRARRLVKEL